ncbi:glycoside hydrolase family 2 protein, partial [bacterium]|nr:glycoside hydrolase family 2 protein [bacterium]
MRQILSLNGDWNFRQPDDTDSLPARVPGCVHLDLLAAERIEDPFYRDNEDRLHWIGETDWIYSRTFDLPEEILKQERILLRCEGLDTLATVTI